MNLQPVPPPRSFDPRTLMADQHSHIPVGADAEVAPQSLCMEKKLPGCILCTLTTFIHRCQTQCTL
jgi:hypothetical protein